MKDFGKNTARFFYAVFFAFSILNFLRLLRSLFTGNDEAWENFFSAVVLLFIGLVIWGVAAAAATKK